MRMKLFAQQPFSLLSVVKSHGWIQLPPFNFDSDTSTLTYVARLDSGLVLELRIRETPTGVSVNVSSSLNNDEKGQV